MKKNYQVIVRGGVKIDSFTATAEQAQAYWSLMYDQEFTKLEELDLPELSDIKVEHEYPYLFIYRGGEHIVSAEYMEDSQTFVQLGVEDGERISDDDITDHLLAFDQVRELCLCQSCGGHGGYDVVEGYIASPMACDCEEVVFRMDQLIPVPK